MPANYELGPFRLDTEAQVLTHAGAAVPLGARGAAVLTVLVSRANVYVQKSAILDAAWPGLVVEEANLSVQISAIRRALALAPGGEDWIETLARRGYRFVGPVKEIAAQSVASPLANRQRTNLPESLTSFVGRERELAEIKERLPTTRLMTLTGIGGLGKTRLARRVGTEMLDAYRDGVWFVDLAPLGDPALVPSALAQVLQVKDVAGQPLLTALCNHLRTRETLLILDNCEHVLDGCAQMTGALLRDAAQVTVIATSREALHLAGECAFPLSALPLPDPRADAKSIAGSDAVQLFIERARQHRPGLDLEAQWVRVVAEICVQLDGIPLALELAAARIAVLPVEQILRMLTERFRLLTSGDRDLPRHQTLRAMLDWSYDLLDDAEKTLFARLSVFAGGWTLEAASQVCSGAPITKDDVVYVLIGLIEQSLVVAERDGDRYRMLETVRLYARDRLLESGEEPAVRERHFAYYSSLAERLEPALLGGAGQKEALDALEADHDNLRSALTWVFEASSREDAALRMCGALHRFWHRRGYWREGRAWCIKALSQASEASDKSLRAKALLGAALLSSNVPEAETRSFLADALSLSRDAGDRKTEAMILNSLAKMLDWNVDVRLARSMLEQARAINRETGNKTLELHNMSNLVNVLRLQGEHEAAIALAEEGLARSRRSGDRWLEAVFLYLRALTACDRHDMAAAERLGEQSLEIFRELRMPDWQSASLLVLGFVAIVRGNAALGGNYLTKVIDISRELGDQQSLAECIAAAGALASLAGHHVEAARLWSAADALLGSFLPDDLLDRLIVQYRSRCRETLGGTVYDSAAASGRALSREAAIDEALIWLRR